MIRALLLAGSAIAAMSAVPASAALITYDFSANVAATVPGVGSYTGPVSLIGTADTDNYQSVNVSGVNLDYVTFDTLNLVAGSTTFDINALLPSGIDIEFGFIKALGIVGFGDITTTIGAGFRNQTVLSQWDGVSSIGPVNVQFAGIVPSFLAAQIGPFVTLTNTTFEATVAAAPAVPEPATWAMMIGGFGLIGGAMRRRQAVTKVSFA